MYCNMLLLKYNLSYVTYVGLIGLTGGIPSPLLLSPLGSRLHLRLLSLAVVAVVFKPATTRPGVAPGICCLVQTIKGSVLSVCAQKMLFYLVGNLTTPFFGFEFFCKCRGVPQISRKTFLVSLWLQSADVDRGPPVTFKICRYIGYMICYSYCKSLCVNILFVQVRRDFEFSTVMLW